MKVLSLLQPFASLIVVGAKRIETRPWKTQYRGPLLIHASTRFPKDYRELCQKEYFSDYVPDWKVLPRGQVIGRADLVDFIPTDELEAFFNMPSGLVSVGGKTWRLTKQEHAFGNYTPNRFGWLLKNPVEFNDPLPAKGSLSLWELPDNIIPATWRP
jgi:hypothetical protein